MRSFAILLAPLALAACGSGTSAGNATDATVNQARVENAGAQVAALPEGQRNGVFYRAIHDAGQDCQNVESSEPAAPYRGNPVWTATCRGGGRWTLVITPDGTVQILNAAEAELVRGNASGNAQ